MSYRGAEVQFCTRGAEVQCGQRDAEGRVAATCTQRQLVAVSRADLVARSPDGVKRIPAGPEKGI